jgi:hypothetical protein
LEVKHTYRRPVLKQFKEVTCWHEIHISAYHFLLLTCCVFVHICHRNYYRVLNIPGAVHYVTSEDIAVAIPEKQIERVNNFLVEEMEAEEALGSHY